MFFPVSKIFWGLCQPSHLLLWCSLLAAILLLVRRYRRAGTVFAVLTALLLIGIGVVPSYTWLIQPLEHRFDSTPYPKHVDGILTLGGGQEDTIRLSHVVMLARRYPNARVVFSGGDGALIDNRPGVAATHATRFLLALGLDPARLTVEGKSRNTFENLQFTQRLVRPRPSETWLLATSGHQLPRAMEIANRLNWKLVPRPTNYLTYRHAWYGYFAIPDNLRFFDMSVREWIGLLVYRWSGHSSGGE